MQQARATQTNFIWVLVAVQLSMCLLLYCFVQSNWYGLYFHKRMENMLLDSYKFSKQKDARLLEDALAYGRKAGEAPINQTQIAEELALYFLPRDSKRSLIYQKRLHNLSKSRDLPADLHELALLREARLQLQIADFLLRNKDGNRARLALEQALADLKAIPASSQRPKSELLRKYLELAIKLAEITDDQKRAKMLGETLLNLSDPSFASHWYQTNGINGYSIDYPADCIASFHLSQTHAGDSHRVEAIKQALLDCRNPELHDAMKANVLIQTATLVNDIRQIRPLFLDVWLEVGSRMVKNSKELSVLIPAIYSTALENGNSIVTLRVLSQYLDALSDGRLSADKSKYIIEDFTGQCGMAKLYELTGKDAETLLKLSQKAQQIAELNKFNSAAPRLMEALALEEMEQHMQAKEKFMQVVQSTSCTHLLADAQEAPLLFISIKRISESLERTSHKDDAVRFLSSLLADKRWCPQARSDLLMCLAEMERRDSTTGTEDWVIKELKQLAEDPQLNKEDRYTLSDFLLRAYTWKQYFPEAEVLFTKLRSEYKHEPKRLADLCSSQLSWLRAFPSLTPQFKERALKKMYPEEAFYIGENLQAQVYGADSIELAKYKLWLAEYELCKGDTKAANAHCQQILANSNWKNSSAYLPAQLIQKEINGEHITFSATQKIQAPRGTSAELDCLWSLLYTSQHGSASSAVKELRSHIIES